ncbi:MAG: O-antigen ligase family protein, partial [Caldisericia bacterium]
LKSEIEIKILEYFFIIIGVVLSILNIFVEYNLINIPGSIIYGRYSSFLQYPNTFSAFLFVPLFISFFKFIYTDNNVFSLISTLLSITIFKTESRGAILILIFLLIIIIFYFIKENKHILSDSIFLLLILPILTMILQGKLNFLSLIIFLILSFVYSKYVRKFKFFKNIYLNIIFLSLFLIIIYFLKDESLKRIFSIFNLNIYFGKTGLSGRNSLILTSINIFKNYPLFGIGLGNYQFVYFKYRPDLIFSKFPHSTPFQFLSETGIVGFFIYIAFIFFVIKKLKEILILRNKSYIAFAFVFMGILLHSFVDFDLSIPVMLYIFFIFLGILFSRISKKKELNETLTLRNKHFTIIFIFLFFSLFVNLLFLFGNIYNNKTNYYLSKGDYNNASIYIQQAVNLDFYNSEYHNSFGNILQEIGIQKKDKNILVEANNEFKKCITLNKLYFKYYADLGYNYIVIGEKNLAEENFKKAIELNPFDPANYVNLSNFYIKTNEIEKAKETLENALELKIENHEIYLLLGDLYKTKNDFINAEIFYKKAIEYKNNFEEAYFKLGKLYIDNNNPQDGIYNLFRSVRLSEYKDEFVAEFKKYSPIVVFLEPTSKTRINTSEKLKIKWRYDGNTKYADYITIRLVKKDEEVIKSIVVNIKTNEINLDIKNIKDGEYYIRIVINSYLMKNYQFVLSYYDSEIFIIE